MKRILSIDFDYFIDTDLNTRNNKFPDGVDEKPKIELLSDWDFMYEKYPEIREDIGVIPEYFKCRDWLSKRKNGITVFSESHKDIYEVFNVCESDSLEVVNIDFHHDNYISGCSKVDCANWVHHLMNEKPDTKFTWVKRKDSETVSLDGEFPYTTITDIKKVLVDNYDYIFICLSPEWTPPHLIDYYNRMVESALRY